MTDTQVPDLFALADPAARPNPYPVYATLREASPFAVADGTVVVVGRYDDCGTVLREPTVSNDPSKAQVAIPGNGGPPARRSFLFRDPPDHTRLRGLVSKAFTPAKVRAMETEIRDEVNELLDHVREADEFDIVRDLAYPVPVHMICRLLGIPLRDYERISTWSERLFLTLDPRFGGFDEETLSEIEATRKESRDYFSELIARRREDPGEDLLSHLIQVEEQGDQLSDEELLDTAVLMLMAGHKATADLISNTILAAVRHPDQLAAVRADPALARGAAEETLRYDPPVQLTTRIARKPLQIGDVTVPEAGLIMLLLAAANRDPGAFEDPDRWDLTRDARRHLSFAAGPHYCIGAGLAPMEATIALQAFAARVVDPELDASSLLYKPSFMMRGPGRMVMGFREIR